MVAEALSSIRRRRRFHSQQTSKLTVNHEAIIKEVRRMFPDIDRWYSSSQDRWECRIPMILLSKVDDCDARATPTDDSNVQLLTDFKERAVLWSSLPSPKAVKQDARSDQAIATSHRFQRCHDSMELLAQATAVQMGCLSKPILGQQVMLGVDDQGKAFVRLIRNTTTK
jgi:hypothetical protein